MGPLRNSRHEAFCRALFENKSADEAYVVAGYKASRQNAHRLTTNEDIRQRLTELQAEAAKKSEVSVQSLLNELEEARLKAGSLEQYGTVVKAIVAKAQIAGISTQRIEVSHSYDFTHCNTTQDVADGIALDYGAELKEKERIEFCGLIQRWSDEVENFLKPLKARTVEIIPPKPAYEYERKRLALVNRS